MFCLAHKINPDNSFNSLCRATSDLNSWLCQTYTVTPTLDRASVYLTKGPAKVSLLSRQAIDIQNEGLRAGDLFDYRAFYLLPGELMTAC